VSNVSKSRKLTGYLSLRRNAATVARRMCAPPVVTSLDSLLVGQGKPDGMSVSRVMPWARSLKPLLPAR
jgi:hypothetical protein